MFYGGITMKRQIIFLVLLFIISNLFSQLDETQNVLLHPVDFSLTDQNIEARISFPQLDDNRDLVGYNIYLDGMFIGFIDDPGMITYFLTGLLSGQSYVIGIEAVYTGGVGLLIEFIYHYNPALNSVNSLSITNLGYASWEPPDPLEDNRELLGYNVYLGVDFVTFTTDLFFQYDENNLVLDQTYVSGITAIYDEGESTTAYLFFMYCLSNPIIFVNPPEISVILDPDELTYHPLNVSNLGTDVLLFEIDINYLSGDSWILLDTSWMYSLEEGEFCELSIPISSAGLEDITLNAELIITNNAGLNVIVPVTMIVIGSLDPVEELYVTESGYICWEPPGQNIFGRELTGYNIYLDNGLIAFATELFYQYDHDILAIGQLYVCGVTAIYNEGESSAQEFDFVYIPTINDPSIVLQLDICNYNSVQLDWELTQNFSNLHSIENPVAHRSLSGFRIYKDEHEIYEITDPAITTYMDVGLNSGNNEYCITAVFYDPFAESLPSNMIDVEIILPAPQNIIWASNYPNILLIWDAMENLRSVEYYNVYRDDVYIDSTTENFYLDVNLPAYSFIYNIAAVFSGGYEGAWSEDVNTFIVETEEELVSQNMFHNIHPNPFNPSTTISFSVTQTSSFVNLEVFNIKGEKVKQLLSERLSAGQHSIVWNGEDESGKPVASGVYYCRMQVAEFHSVKKMILLK
jgi:FlgD Ig-like domain